MRRDGQQTPGTKVGTAGYMAPEMVNEASYGAPADVYAFGLFLYEVLVQKRAWTAEDLSKFYNLKHPNEPKVIDEKTDMAMIVSALNLANCHGYLPNLGALDELLTGGATNLVRSCLAVDPEQRPLVGQVTHVIRNSLTVRNAGQSAVAAPAY
jgi:serine/threonine protein kinase